MDSVAPAEKLAPVGRVFDVESAMLTGPAGWPTAGGASAGAGPPMVIDGVSRTSRCSTGSRARPRGVRPARPDPGCSHDRRLSIQEDIIAAPVAWSVRPAAPRGGVSGGFGPRIMLGSLSLVSHGASGSQHENRAATTAPGGGQTGPPPEPRPPVTAGKSGRVGRIVEFRPVYGSNFIQEFGPAGRADPARPPAGREPGHGGDLMSPRALQAVAVLTLALAGTAAAQGPAPPAGSPGNAFLPDPVGLAGPTVMPVQGYLPPPGPVPGPMPGPPPGAIPGPVPVGDPHLPAGTIDGHADVWGPTCWIGAEYLLWWVKHGPNRTPLATVAPGNTFGLLTDPNSHVVLGGDTFKYNNFSGVRILGGVWLSPSQTVGIEGNFFILPTKTIENPPVLATDGFPTLARPFLDLTNNAQNTRVLTRPGLFVGGIRDSSDTLLWGSEIAGSFRLWERGGFTLDGLTGFKFLDLEESLQVNDFSSALSGGTINFAGRTFRQPAATFVEDRFTTLNRFYGYLIGTRANFHVQAFTLSLTGKVGLGGVTQTVQADGTTTLIGPFPAPVVTGGGFYAAGSNSGRFRVSEFTYVPEFSANLTVQVTPHLTLSGGYTYLYINRVARPGDQITGAINPTQVPTAPNFGATFTGRAQPFEVRHSDYFAHGLNVGLLYGF